MRGFPFGLNGQGVLELVEEASLPPPSPEKNDIFLFGAYRKEAGREPNSVLDHRRSPSPPTSTSTFSSSPQGSGGEAAVFDDSLKKWPAPEDAKSRGGRKEEWASELQPIPGGIGLMGSERCCLGMEEWDNVLAEPLPPAIAAFPAHETPALLKWILGGSDDLSSVALKQPSADFDGNNMCDHSGTPVFGLQEEQSFGLEPLTGITGASNHAFSSGGFDSSGANLIAGFPSSIPTPNGLPMLPSMFYEGQMEERSNIFSPGVVLNHNQQNTPFLLPMTSYAQAENQQLQFLSDPSCQISPKFPSPDTIRDHPFMQPFHGAEQKQMKLKAAGDGLMATLVASTHNQQFVGQLLKAAEMVEGGNFGNAREILARLNHQQLFPERNPLLRSAFYFKEVIYNIAANNCPNMPFSSSSPSLQLHPLAAPATPLDVVLKLSAYKAFSEVSPILQFTNFTCIQAILEEVSGCDHIHIVDFDIGIGGQWSSFIQELSQRRCAGTVITPSLKITAFVSPSSYHPLELLLARENLSCFAGSLGIPFELNILSIDSFEPTLVRDMSSSGSEVIAVNIPVGSPYTLTPVFLRLVKQLSPKIVISVDNCCDRNDLSFSQYFANALQSCTVLLESLDASGAPVEIINKIEQFILQPRIESSVLGRYCCLHKLYPWQSMFVSANFVPVHFSNFTETQADCLLKKVHARGFHIEKRQSSLLLLWKRNKLASVSAWKC